MLVVAFAAVVTSAEPASALITIEGGTTATFAWAPASGNVAGYYVLVVRDDGAIFLYSTVYGRNWETVTANPSQTISVRVVAFDSTGAYGEPSAPSEPVLFGAASTAPPPRGYGQARDFDGDGVSDVIVQSDTRGYLEVTSMKTGESTLLMKCKERVNKEPKCSPVRMNGRAWMIVGNGDYDGDGVTDILFRKHRNGVQLTGTVSVFFMDGDRIREIAKLSTEICVERANGSIKCKSSKTRVKKDWEIVGSGDYNGDGRSDVLLHNASTNQFDLWTMVGGATYESALLPDDFGNAAEVIASGDFDGDGISDILWRNLVDGEVEIWGLTYDSTLGPLEGGASRWSVMGAGDFDGDQRDDLLLRAIDTDQLAVRLSTTGTRSQIASALNEGARERQVPSIGDYDGDGLTDLVVYDSEADETQLWMMEGSVVAASEILPSPRESWDFATVDLRPPGSR